MATQTHYRTCNLCEAMCGIEIKVDGSEILSIRGDKNDLFSRGHICPKAVALQDIYHDPDRLRYPVRRMTTGWQQIGWDEAFDEVVSNIKAIQQTYGRNAVGAYVGNPNVHNIGSILYLVPFLRALRSRNRFSATSVDQLPHHFASYFMFGHQFLIPIPDIDRTDFFLILGANPLASNGSLMTAPVACATPPNTHLLSLSLPQGRNMTGKFCANCAFGWKASVIMGSKRANARAEPNTTLWADYHPTRLWTWRCALGHTAHRAKTARTVATGH